MFAVLWSAIVSAFVALAPRLLMMFGVVAVSETLSRQFFNKLLDMVTTHYNGIPSQFRVFVDMTGLMDAIAIIFTAYITAIGIKAARSAMSAKAAKFDNPTAGK